jgi:G3E family GTPase
MAVRLQRRHARQRCTLVGLVQSAKEAQKQLAMADRVILNKIDLVADETISEIERTIRSAVLTVCIAASLLTVLLILSTCLSTRCTHSAVAADRSIR